MPYEWDEWAINALAGIEPYAVRQVVEATGGGLAQRSTQLDYGCSQLGRTLAGRGLIVAVSTPAATSGRSFGAREMRTEELAEFARRGDE